MPNIYRTFEVGVKGLMSQQLAMEVTGHNIANANSPGFSRQRAEIVTSYPLTVYPGQIGTGSEVEDIVRIRNAFIDFQIRTENQALGQWEIKQDILRISETIFDETSEGGINTALSEFWNSWQQLSLYPEDSATRATVRAMGESLAFKFNQTDERIANLQDDVNNTIAAKVEEINAIAEEIATLNTEIDRVELVPHMHANDLRDQRDNLIDDLSKFANLSVDEDSTGKVTVFFGTRAIVDGRNAYKIEAVTDSTDPRNFYLVQWVDSGTPVTTTDGELYGLFSLRDTILQGYKDQLSTMASRLIEEVNKVHSMGIGLQKLSSLTSDYQVSDPGEILSNVAQSGLLFSATTGTFDITVSIGGTTTTSTISFDASTDTLNTLAAKIDALADMGASIDGSNRLVLGTTGGAVFSIHNDTSGILAALGINTFFKGTDSTDIALAAHIVSDLDNIAASRSGAPGDNANALAMAQLKETTFQIGDEQQTFDQYFNGLVAKVGVDTQLAIRTSDNQTLLLEQLATHRESVSGVSLDEEMTNLLKFERAYEGCARFITAIDEMIDTIINHMGIAGR